MKIHRVFLSAKVEEKIWQKHHVERWEVFDIFYNEESKIYRHSLEQRQHWVVLSKTTAGRLLAVFFIPRRGAAYVATAYDMPERYRRLYLRSD